MKEKKERKEKRKRKKKGRKERKERRRKKKEEKERKKKKVENTTHIEERKKEREGAPLSNKISFMLSDCRSTGHTQF